MKKLILGLALVTSMNIMAQNPFFEEFNTVHNTPPFSQINAESYPEAIDRAIALNKQEVDMICNQRSTPDFDNTIVALENAGKDLNRVLSVFYNLLEANSDDRMMEISLEVSPKLSDLSTSIMLNERLWLRIKEVYANRDKFNLAPEQMQLLQNTYDSFARNGARLEGADREKYRQIQAELSELTTRFGQNVLKELKTYNIYLTEEEMAGLPADLIAAAAADAEAAGKKGEYLFTLAQPTYIAVLKSADRRDVRERFYRLYAARNTKGEFSNVEIMKRIANLRLELANLLGYKSYAEYSLVKTMAGNPNSVYDLLNRLRDAYKPALQAEMKELNEFASELEGEPIEVKPWDYSYYSNKLRNARYSYDEEEMRPYFPLNQVEEGVFGLANKLYGLTFTQNDSIEVYHPDVKAYDVKDSDGRFLGVLYTDFFPRDSKRPGAWMTNFRDQYIDEDGVNHRPQVSIVMNFTKPTADK
ncbi:MAG: peptidase M3, partial [Muribaculaceae bacterium]|nr:peptidase M3 [Muribaculaceae bacterium]